MDEYEKGLYEQLVKGEKLTESELIDFLEFEVDIIEGGDRRWYRSITTISKIGDKFFAMEWDKGLTENQEDEFYNQPYEVELEEAVVTKTIKKWNKIQK
jgi:hypothetical protein